MECKVYVNAKSQTGLIAEHVKILEISEAPRITKKGKLFKQPFEGSKHLTPYQVSILNLWEQGIRKADVVYPDGTSDVEVWVNMKDIEGEL